MTNVTKTSKIKKEPKETKVSGSKIELPEKEIASLKRKLKKAQWEATFHRAVYLSREDSINSLKRENEVWKKNQYSKLSELYTSEIEFHKDWRKFHEEIKCLKSDYESLKKDPIQKEVIKNLDILNGLDNRIDELIPLTRDVITKIQEQYLEVGGSRAELIDEIPQAVVKVTIAAKKGGKNGKA